VPRIEHPEFASRDETIASVMLRDYDRLASNSGARADIPGLPFWANKRLIHRDNNIVVTL
jgi:hypothetical protein